MRRTRTALSALVAVTTMSLFVPMASAAPTPPSSDVSGATALLTGTLVLVADAHRGEDPGAPSTSGDHEDAVQAYLDVDGTSVPVPASSVEGVGSQSVVTVEVPVPADVAAAVVQGEPVAVATPADGGDEAVIPVSELQAAQEEPAPADSDLAAATAVSASGGEAPVAVSVVEVTAATTPPVSRAPHEVTVAVVGVNGKTDARYTDREVARLVEETSDYWSDQTAGAVTFATTGKAARYTSAISCTSYGNLWNEAKVKTGFQDGANRHLVLMVPRGAYDAKHCSYGLGSLGSGASTGGVSYIADVSWPVLAHELGHNMSLNHANRLRCSTASPDVAQSSTGAFTDTKCSEDAYGDRADVMSSSGMSAAGGLGVVGLRQLGLLDAGDQRSVAGAGVTSVELAPLGTGAGLRVATVTDPRNGNTYHLENRQGVGRDHHGFGGTGIYDADDNPWGSPAGLRVLKRGATGTSVLLDPTPTACTSTCPRDVDAVLAPGSIFRTVSGGLEVRARQRDDGSVVADVSVAGAGQQHWVGAQGPSAVVPDAGSRSTTPGTAVQLTGTVTTSDGKPAAGRVRATSTSSPSVEGVLDAAGRYSLSWTPTTSGTTRVSITHLNPAGQVGGTAALTVSVGEGTVVTAGAVKARSTAATTLPVTVTNASTRALVPSGTVTVTADGVRLGSASVSRGKASVKLPALPRGRKDLTVTYEPAASSGGIPVTGSSAVVALDVAGAPVRVTTTLTPRTVTIADAPSATVSVSASGAVPTGTVTVADGPTTLGSGELVKGRATIALPLQALGKHDLVATYAGDEKVEGGRSTAAVLTVTPLPTSVVTASAARATTAQQVTVTASVRAAGRPGSGEITLVRDGQAVVSGQLVNGRVALRLPLLPAGKHQFSVVHGDSPAVTGGAKAVTVTVTPAKPVVTAVLASSTVTQGSGTTIAVTVGAPGVEATGSVRLMRSRTVLGEAALDGGRATLTVPGDLPVGRQSLTVAYPGSSQLTAGTVTVPVTVLK